MWFWWAAEPAEGVPGVFILVPSHLVKFNEARLCHTSKPEAFSSVAGGRLNDCSSRFSCDHSRLNFVILYLGLLFAPVTLLSF